MQEFNQEPVGSENDSASGTRRSARYGLLLFVVYLLFYGVFVSLNAFVPSVMQAEVLTGINLAVAYGMGLIVAALALALLYSWLCRDVSPAPAKEERR